MRHHVLLLRLLLVQLPLRRRRLLLVRVLLLLWWLLLVWIRLLLPGVGVRELAVGVWLLRKLLVLLGVGLGGELWHTGGGPGGGQGVRGGRGLLLPLLTRGIPWLHLRRAPRSSTCCSARAGGGG